MQYRREAGNEGYRNGGMHIRRYRYAVKEGRRQEGMQKRRDAGQMRCRTRGIQDRRDHRKGGMQDRRDAGK